MTLRIYELADPTTYYSVSGVMDNPLRVSIDSRHTTSMEKLLYLRNDSLLHTYSGLAIQAVDTEGDSIVDGTNSFSWKIKEGATRPTEEEWDSIADGNAESMTNITDSTTYLPFWVRIEIPLNASVETYDDVVLRITGWEDTI